MIEAMEVDWPTSKVIENLVFVARNRLDDCLRTGGSFTADKTEIGLRGVSRLFLQVKGRKPGSIGKIVSMITLEGGLVWTNYRLEVSTAKFTIDQAILSALRGKPLAVIADHPILQNFTISSAKKGEHSITFRIKRWHPIAYGDLNRSTRSLPDLDRNGLYTAHKIRSLDPVAAHAIATLGPQALATLSGRWEQSPYANVLDLMPFKPGRFTSLTLKLQEGDVSSVFKTKVGIYLIDGNELRHTHKSSDRTIQNFLDFGMFKMGRPYTPRPGVWKLVHERLEPAQVEGFLASESAKGLAYA